VKFYLRLLNLDLNEAKTLITHATTQKAYFLGYFVGITSQTRKPIIKVKRDNSKYYMRVNTRPQLLAPIPYLLKKLKENGIAKQVGQEYRGTAKNLYVLYDLNTIVNTMRSL
jgi:hypothetical protein